MSTENNTLVESVTDDLDSFSSDFFGQKKVEAEPASSEANEDEEQESDATLEDTSTSKEDTHEGDDDTPSDEDDSDDGDDESDDNDKPKPKKSRAQERIEELNRKYRETERLVKELQEKLDNQNKKPEPAPNKVVEDTGPTPDDRNEDGTDKYPLGEFDPNYIRDLTKHTLAEEKKAMDAKAEQSRAQEELDKQRAELQTGWQEKLGPAQERYPDFQEKGEQLLDTFSGINQDYGEYLAATLMSMDYGPDVLYYLASNPDEASKIVASGPTKATIALGRLESKFASADEAKQKARPKVSQAPTPPPTNEGAAPVKTDIPDDTDDLDAFAKKLFKKK